MIHVVLVDDHPMFREGLAKALADHGDLRVVAQAGTADELFAVLRNHSADVVVLDISMPGPGIVPVLQQIGREYPDVRSLVLSMHPEQQYAVRVLRAGAAGYVMKESALEQLVHAVRRTYEGGTFISDTSKQLLVSSADRAMAPHELLSDRELEVLRRLASGHSVKEIGASLGISPKTVSTYRTRLLQKLGVASNADLVRYVIEHGLIRP